MDANKGAEVKSLSYGAWTAQQSQVWPGNHFPETAEDRQQGNILTQL